MFNLFKKKTGEENQNDHLSLISVAALLIHSAKFDENFRKIRIFAEIRAKMRKKFDEFLRRF